MRVLFWALTLGAMAGSAERSMASPIHSGVFEQFPEQTFALANAAVDYPHVTHNQVNGWIPAAFLSAPQYETVSTMAGFHEAPGTGPEESIWAGGEPTFDWDVVDALHSPGDLKGLVLPELRYVLSDDDDSILDVVQTGSPAPLEPHSEPHESAWALDSL
jgi:hypothetical protein